MSTEGNVHGDEKEMSTEMSTEGKRLRYTEFVVLFSIPKGNVDIKSNIR